MFKLLHEEKNYLNLLKESVNPSIGNRVNEYSDYVDYMEEVEDILLDEQILLELPVDLSALKNTMKDMMGMKTDLKYKLAKLTPGNSDAKAAIYKQLHSLDQKIGVLKDKIAQAASGAGKAISKGAGEVSKAAGEYAGKASKAAGKAYGQVSKAAGEVGKQASAGASKAASAVQKFAGTTGGKYAAAGAAAAGAALAAYAVYKRFFSQAAKACKGKSGAEKTSCMKAYKVKGLQAAMAKCGSDAKCKAKFQGKIAKLKG